MTTCASATCIHTDHTVCFMMTEGVMLYQVLYATLSCSCFFCTLPSGPVSCETCNGYRMQGTVMMQQHLQFCSLHSGPCYCLLHPWLRVIPHSHTPNKNAMISRGGWLFGHAAANRVMTEADLLICHTLPARIENSAHTMFCRLPYIDIKTL